MADNENWTKREMASALRSVREIVTISTGFTLTNSMLVLFTHGYDSSSTSLSKLPLQAALCTIVVVLITVYFHHANARNLDAAFGMTDGTYRSVLPFGDSTGIILLRASVLVAMSFCVYHPQELLTLFVLLIVLDVASIISRVRRCEIESSISLLWLLSPAMTVILLLIAYATHMSVLGLGAIMANILFDFGTSKTFYFPSPRNALDLPLDQ
jgi:hypothetical protein